VGDLVFLKVRYGPLWGLAARVNLILLVHNLIRSRVLLKMAWDGAMR
jgi:hypothetical protein